MNKKERAAKLVEEFGYPIRDLRDSATRRVRVMEHGLSDGQCDAMSAVHGDPVPAGYMSEERQWVIEYQTAEDALTACGLDD